MSCRLAVLATSLLLGACATLAPEGVMPPRPARTVIEAFSLDGRLSVTRGEERAHAAVAWSHDPGGDRIDVFSPLGQQLARLTGTAAGARLETSDRRVLESDSLEALSEEVFGARLPLQGLPAWVVGRPAGHSASVQRDEQARARQLREDGWRIDYLDYESPAPDALPSLMELQRDGIRVRLKIDQWNLPR